MKGIEIANGSLKERRRLNCNTTNLELLATAIEAKYNSHAIHLESVWITQPAEGKAAWDGAVEVFTLMGHGSVKLCYGWVEYTSDSQHQYVTVPQKGPVASPETAVKAWLTSEHVIIEPIAVAPYWHGQHFLKVGTISDL